MAPLLPHTHTHTHTVLDLAFTTAPTILPRCLHLRRRWSSTSTSFDTTFMLSIIGLVIILTIMVIAALCIRSRKRKVMRRCMGMDPSKRDSERWGLGRKEKSIGRRGWVDPALEIPPPVYTKGH
ncbi:hypothetical protein P280DRAFT_516668 [Massarina eburnea CBS 473.64]|uniref:Uncharacterized protein n=1 Tax=Massarina eburnea CBS 473.64 TaxID=1395130 RepID=A0A6A6S2T7_9PLEO|nr:hypothetical protein P280DRAFT_516668 [Massarina eburnea CBS 473.64]